MIRIQVINRAHFISCQVEVKYCAILPHPSEITTLAYGKSIILNGPTQDHLSRRFIVPLANPNNDGVVKQKVTRCGHVQADIRSPAQGRERGHANPRLSCESYELLLGKMRMAFDLKARGPNFRNAQYLTNVLAVEVA